MKIAFSNGKGGTGKTTSCVLVALALSSIGRSVVVRDLDPQKTATKWLEGSDVPEDRLLLVERPDVDYTLIDTPPRLDSTAFQKGVGGADVIVIPTSPSPADLDTTLETVELLTEMGIDGRARILYTNVQANTQLASQLDARAKDIGIPAFRTRIPRRQVYQHSLLIGWKRLPTMVREEILSAALEITTTRQRKKKS